MYPNGPIINYFFYLYLQGKKLPEARGILLIALLSDMLNTIIRQLVSLSGSNSKGVDILIPYAVLTAITYIIFIAFNITYIVRHYVIKDEDEKERTHVLIKTSLLIVETAGTMMYFYGDNISFILENHGDELKCDLRCVENVRISAAIFLGLALICYQFAPGLRRLTNILGFETETTGVHLTVDMIAVFPQIDVVFTVVVTMAQTDDFCSRKNKAYSRAFFILCILAGWGLMSFSCILAMIKFHRDNSFKWIPLALLCLLAICFPLYMLADNSQPLD